MQLKYQIRGQSSCVRNEPDSRKALQQRSSNALKAFICLDFVSGPSFSLLQKVCKSQVHKTNCMGP